MTYNPKENKLSPEQLPTSQYEQGFQNKKMERQAIKGLSPKFCYARLKADQTLTKNVYNHIDFDDFETNDSRMPDVTNGDVKIPQAGLWVLSAVASINMDVGSEISMYLTLNGIPNFNGLIIQTSGTRGATFGTILNLSIPVFLNQDDVIGLEVIHNNATDKVAYYEYMTLRAISYVLY